MFKSPLLFAISVLVTWLSWSSIAKANDDPLALTFSLPPVSATATVPEASPHKIEAVAIAPPPTANGQTENVQTENGQTENAQLKHPQAEAPHDATLSRYEDPLPPLAFANTPPSAPEQQDEIALSFASAEVTLPMNNSATDNKAEITAPQPTENHSEQNSTADLYPSEIISDNAADIASLLALPSTHTAPPTQIAKHATGLDDWIFEGGSSSLVAHTVGSAEGTRSADGTRTQAYYGHVDPGNGVWNLGTFSYQHGATTPEEADVKQLQRLKKQGLQLEEKAAKHGIKLSLEAKLNGIDLANQAPLAALDRGGYIEQLAKAYRLNMTGEDAIVWARTHAYLDPDTKQWNAPGLGNNVYSIDRDQRRRADAIAAAHKAYISQDAEALGLANLNSISLEAASEPAAVSFGAATAKTTSTNSAMPSEVRPSEVRPSQETNQSALSFHLTPTPAPTSTPIAPADLLTSSSDTGQAVVPVEGIASEPPEPLEPEAASQPTASSQPIESIKPTDAVEPTEEPTEPPRAITAPDTLAPIAPDAAPKVLPVPSASVPTAPSSTELTLPAPLANTEQQAYQPSDQSSEKPSESTPRKRFWYYEDTVGQQAKQPSK
ncbi:MAG: hypothetical protein HC800_01875 [Phormidesmis sp. RL_2_1]|nr:hypothetical protein [Phormidesmis sp. RL_2_1]